VANVVNVWILLSCVLIGRAVQGADILYGLFALGAQLQGVWMMTKPDPSGIGEDTDVTARRVLRTSTLILVVLTALRFIMGAASAYIGRSFTWLFDVVELGMLITGVVAYVAQFSFFAIFAVRMPNEFLVRHAENFQRRFVLFVTLLLIGVALDSVFQGYTVIHNVVMILKVVPLIYIVGHVVLAIKYINQMQKALVIESEAAAFNWTASVRKGIADARQSATGP